MGTRANTTLAWMTTGLLVTTAPFVALANLEGNDWDAPAPQIADLDAGVDDFDTTVTGDTPTGAGDTSSGVDALLPTADGGVPPGSALDAGGTPRLPDGGSPVPLVEDTNAGCQCTHARDGGALPRSALPIALGLVLAMRRRARHEKKTGRTPEGASPSPSGHPGGT